MKTRWKIIGGILSAIILGAIGSGLWELCIKKLIFLFGELIIKMLVTIKTSFLTDIYTEASKGNINQVLIDNNNYLGVIIFFLTYLIVLIFLSTILTRLKFNKVFKLIDKDFKDQEDSYKSVLFEKFPGKKIISKIPPVFFAEILLILCFCLLFIYSYRNAKIQYINTAIEQFRYLNVNVQPYTTDDYIKKINSRFSQINSKEDYDLIIKELKEISNKNNIKKRVFNTL